MTASRRQISAQLRPFERDVMPYLAGVYSAALCLAGDPAEARSYLLTTQGRTTGRPRSNPVVPVEHGGRRGLGPPSGPGSRVHNPPPARPGGPTPPPHT